MTVQDLINVLELVQNKSKFFRGTFVGICGRKNVTIFSENDEYRELYISEDDNIQPITIQEAINELELTEHKDIPIILTIGNEDKDIFSTKGGVEFKYDSLFVDTKTAPQQA